MTLEASLRGKQILIVDDLVEARSSLKSMLSMLGVEQVDTATDGREAMEMIMEVDYDLVLSDYNLGKGKDGQQILEEARYTNRLRATASFIMVTGENALDRVMGALEHEPDAYITKPFTLAMLRERMGRLLNLKEIMRPINQAIDLGEIDWAVELGEKLLAENPRLLLPLSRVLGRLYLGLERYSDSLRIYSNVVGERNASWARLGQGLSMHYLGDSESAVKMMLATLEDHPMQVQCHDWLARIYQSQGLPEQAQKQLQAAVQISPRAVLRQMELGNLAFANNDFKVAEMAYEQAIKLGRHSCFKSSEHYLRFTRALQQSLSEESTRENRQMCVKATRALDEMRQEYSGQLSVVFDANIAESKTFELVADQEKAISFAEKAWGVLERIKKPTPEQQMQMSETYLSVGQDEKALNMMGKLRGKNLNATIQQRLDALDNALKSAHEQEHSAKMNDIGVEHFKRGELSEAIEAFDQAIKFEQASLNVILNCIQAKVSFMEKNDVDVATLKDCYRLFRRIGRPDSSDGHYERFTLLKTTCERFRRAVGV